MKAVVAGLKWFAKFLENRFPERLDLSSLATKTELADHTAKSNSSIANLMMEVEALKVKYEEQKKLNEIISLRVGLSRPTYTVPRSVK